ncbi:helix-turn-helix domain-containing protein [Streptomyces sp. NPDC001410]
MAALNRYLVGVPCRRLAELTGISRATVARWGKSAKQ